MWRICLSPPCSASPLSLISKQGDMETKPLSAMWLKLAPKEGLASSVKAAENLIWEAYTFP